ncbi:MAG: hypothetical protein AB7C92_07945 [Synergistaceae bacterium]
MPRGMPDWGEYSPQELIDKTLDMAELAARLGSPCLYDRRGTVIFYDDFNTGDSKWFKLIGGNLRIQPSAKNAFLGGYSLSFYDDASFDLFPEILISIPFITQTPIGVEGAFCLTSDYTLCYIIFTVVYQGYLNKFWFIYNRETKQVTIKKDDGTFPVVANNVVVPVGPNSWFTMKLVVNPLTGKYVRGRFNSQIIDLSAYSCYKEASTEPEKITVGIALGTTTTTAVTNYLGFAIITQNE